MVNSIALNVLLSHRNTLSKTVVTLTQFTKSAQSGDSPLYVLHDLDTCDPDLRSRFSCQTKTGPDEHRDVNE